jgi:hypothetical protein
MERLNVGEDLLRIRMQFSHPPRALTIKAPQSELGGKVHEDRVEGNVAVNITPGAEGRQTRAGGIPFVQESIAGGVKERGTFGCGVFDHHGETADQEVRRVEDNQLIFPGDSLGGADQRRVCRQQKRLTLTLNQSVPWHLPGSYPCITMCSTRLRLSLFKRTLMDSLSSAQGAMRIVA